MLTLLRDLRPDLRGETNLVPNSFMRTWSGAVNVPPDGWTLAGVGGSMAATITYAISLSLNTGR